MRTHFFAHSVTGSSLVTSCLIFSSSTDTLHTNACTRYFLCLDCVFIAVWAEAMCVCVTETERRRQRGTPLAASCDKPSVKGKKLIGKPVRKSLTQRWWMFACVSGRVQSPRVCQDGAISHLAEATSQVLSFRKAKEGNPDRAWTG